MSVITVRNLDSGTRDRLKEQALAHGRSMEAEARAILTAAVTAPGAGGEALGSRISALFADLEGDGLPAVRSGEAARAASFDS